MLDVEALFAQINKGLAEEKESSSSEVEKTASAPAPESETVTETTEVVEDKSMEKLASELYAAGQILAEGFIDRTVEKLASGVAAGGGGVEQGSKWQRVAQKIENMHAHVGPGDSTSLSAEQAGALSGAKGVVNPAKKLPKGGK